MAVPLIVIVVVLFVRGNSIPVRGSVIEDRLPRSPQPRRIWQHALIWPAVVFLLSTGVSIGGVTIIPQLTGTWQLGLTTSLILAILSLSYVVLVGYMGQISLAQLALAGTAAFVTVRLMSDGEGGTLNGPGLPLLIAVPAGMAAAVIIGMLVGLPALRIRGVQLAVVTMAAVMMLEEFYFKNPELTGLTTGSGARVPEPRIFGLDVGVVSESGLSDSRSFTMFVVVVLTLCAIAVANLRRGDTGRRFLAVRGNERAAAAAGVNVTRTKLLAFAIASALAGLSGIMMGFQQQTISSANFALLLGLTTLAFAYLGGITSVNGAIVAGLIGTGGLNTVFMRYHFEGITDYITVIGGIGLILTSISHPGGIAVFVQPLIQKLGTFVLHAKVHDWARAARKVVPIAAVGALAGWLIWARRDKYSWWMILLGVYLSLLIYGIVMRVTHGRRAAVSDAQSEGLVVVDDGRGPLTAAAAEEPAGRAPHEVTT
jgi:branched-chain amino acid transport system permease protein